MPVPSHTARRNSRRRVRLRVTANRGRSFTTNVSAGGFCTELMRVLPVGARVEGLIHLNGYDGLYIGQVLWAQPGDSRLNQMGRMGVSFMRIDPEFARSLAREAESAPVAI